MSDLFLLRPQQFREVDDVRGCNPPTTSYSPVDIHVWDGMALQPQETACLRGEPFNEAAFASWSWDVTSCVAMMPFTVSGWHATGIFTQISSYAAQLGIEVGSKYLLRFGPCDCDQASETHASCASVYELTVFRNSGSGSGSRNVVHRQVGDYNWTRISRTDPNDGMGGANIQASIQFTPTSPRMRRPLNDWGSIWIARERFSGSWQSVLGFATFELRRPQ